MQNNQDGHCGKVFGHDSRTRLQRSLGRLLRDRAVPTKGAVIERARRFVEKIPWGVLGRSCPTRGDAVRHL